MNTHKTPFSRSREVPQADEGMNTHKTPFSRSREVSQADEGMSTDKTPCSRLREKVPKADEGMLFADHFSAVAADYAQARPEYPDALFAWIAAAAPARGLSWEAGCGSGQASRGLARHFDRVLATDPSAAQVARAHGPGNIAFAVQPGERCSLADASVDAVCVAQALHWFDRAAFFAQCHRVLKPGGMLVAWGYQDVEVPAALAAANAALQEAIRPYWPPERALVDAAYAGFDWPFEALPTPTFRMQADWPLARLLGYFSSYSATRRCREATGVDPVARLAPDFASAWGDPDATQPMHWPLFVHARRKAH